MSDTLEHTERDEIAEAADAQTPYAEASYEQTVWFGIVYAMQLERLHANLYSRVGNLVAFLLVLSSTAVVAQLVPQVSAIAVTILACWQFVYRPEQRAAAHKAQFVCYKDLYQDFPLIPIEESANRLKEARRKDNDTLGGLHRAAYNLASEQVGVPTGRFEGVGWWGRFLLVCSE